MDREVGSELRTERGSPREVQRRTEIHGRDCGIDLRLAVIVVLAFVLPGHDRLERERALVTGPEKRSRTTRPLEIVGEAVVVGTASTHQILEPGAREESVP